MHIILTNSLRNTDSLSKKAISKCADSPSVGGYSFFSSIPEFEFWINFILFDFIATISRFPSSKRISWMAEKIKKPEGKPGLFSRERFQREYLQKQQRDNSSANKPKVFLPHPPMKFLISTQIIEPINTNIKPIRKKFIKKKREHTIDQINDLLLEDVCRNCSIEHFWLNSYSGHRPFTRIPARKMASAWELRWPHLRWIHRWGMDGKSSRCRWKFRST